MLCNLREPAGGPSGSPIGWDTAGSTSVLAELVRPWTALRPQRSPRFGLRDTFALLGSLRHTSWCLRASSVSYPLTRSGSCTTSMCIVDTIPFTTQFAMMKARNDETWAQHQLRMGDIGVRVGWGVVSWLYAARDTVAACSHNSTIWHNDGHNEME